jgi:monoamine oxidase
VELDQPISRRGVLGGALALGAAAALERSSVARGLGRRGLGGTGGGSRAGGSGDGEPRVAIVGAGLAGLTCALRLHQRGVATTVYEAHADRVGGRCWTARGFAAGQTAEHGGEFIDSRHDRIRALCAELGLALDDVKAAARRSPDASPRLFLDGAVRRLADVYRHEGLLTAQADADSRRVGDYHWLRPSRAARELDEMTAAQWLDRALPGSGERLLRLATEQYMAEEYGLDVDRLSAIAMLTAFGSDSVPSDERFHVRGGNDRMAWGMHDRLPAGTVRMDHALVRLRRRGSAYALAFAGQPGEVRADVVVLCLPFTALRRVDLGAAGLGARKRRCVEELGMGTNAKLLLQFRRHLQSYDDFDGEYYDEHLDTWDSSLAERGAPGLLTVFSGGRRGADYPATRPHAPAPARVVAATTAAISRAVPGLAAGYDGHSWLDHWASDPWTHGSYAAFEPGQFTRYWGFVGLPEGAVHFGGEHTATAAQGFLEGAVRSGERCAGEVAARLGAGAATVPR